jgi:hypothetical protein
MVWSRFGEGEDAGERNREEKEGGNEVIVEREQKKMKNS